MNYVCRCNKCYRLYQDTNPQIDVKQYPIYGLEKLEDKSCPTCLTDGYLMDVDHRQIAETLWSMLGDIPVSNNEKIETNFLNFDKGTDRYYIWHWFEETFNLSVAKDLMFK